MIYVVGGGTFSYVRNHLALAAPAFGSTARDLSSLLSAQGEDVYLVLTRMADHSSSIETADDLRTQVLPWFANPEVKAVIWNPAICDFDGKIGDVDSGKYAERLKTSVGPQVLAMTPAAKLVQEIRAARPDVFLVSFKTTTGASDKDMYGAGRIQAAGSGSNLVFVNDTVRRRNLVVTASGETTYNALDDRDAALRCLVSVFTSERAVWEARQSPHAPVLNVS